MSNPSTSPFITTSIHMAYNASPDAAREIEKSVIATHKNGPGFTEWLTDVATKKIGSVHTECILSKFHTLNPYMQRQLDRARVLANFPHPVLIQGPTGSGKEMLANSLHGLRNIIGKFIPVNCTALPADLIESELFGHRRGSFTGAVMDRIGKFYEAENGTIFLDEVGDMPMTMQAKLLRVLQDGKFSPIGDNVIYHSSARVVAATNKNLLEMIKNGEFRQDLYDRLSIFKLKLIDLQERGNEEILYLLMKMYPKLVFSQEELKEITDVYKIKSVRELQSIALNKQVFGRI